ARRSAAARSRPVLARASSRRDRPAGRVDQKTEVLQPAFMQLAPLAALAVGLAAPAIGIYLVQRRLALLGDGIGHTALLGVALAALLGTASIPTAAGVAVIGAVIIEIVRAQGRTSGDVALALLFYGGIAGGVLLF